MQKILRGLDKVRTPQNDISVKKKVLYSILVLALGIVLGTASKVLDETAVNELPAFLEYLDIGNFLGRFSIWVFIAVCISVYSNSPKRAALNVLLFFIGMVSSYYIYSNFVAGFFPQSYAMIWFCITVLSPIPAYFCWYARGSGWFAIVISALIIGVLFSQTVYLLQGVRITYIPEVIVWLASLLILRRKLKEFAIAVALSIPVALLIQLFLPVWGWS